MKKFSLRPFGFKGKIFERRRDAEKFVEDLEKLGGKARWFPFGKRFKVFYSSEKK